MPQGGRSRGSGPSAERLQALDRPSRRHRHAPATDGDEIPGRDHRGGDRSNRDRARLLRRGHVHDAPETFSAIVGHRKAVGDPRSGLEADRGPSGDPSRSVTGEPGRTQPLSRTVAHAIFGVGGGIASTVYGTIVVMGDPDGRVHERERAGSLRPSSPAPTARHSIRSFGASTLGRGRAPEAPICTVGARSGHVPSGWAATPECRRPGRSRQHDCTPSGGGLVLPARASVSVGRVGRSASRTARGRTPGSRPRTRS
jgi:hypothetical protein